VLGVVTRDADRRSVAPGGARPRIGEGQRPTVGRLRRRKDRFSVREDKRPCVIEALAAAIAHPTQAESAALAVVVANAVHRGRRLASRIPRNSIRPRIEVACVDSRRETKKGREEEDAHETGDNPY
jgi:hypothetical protein